MAPSPIAPGALDYGILYQPSVELSKYFLQKDKFYGKFPFCFSLVLLYVFHNKSTKIFFLFLFYLLLTTTVCENISSPLFQLFCSRLESTLYLCKFRCTSQCSAHLLQNHPNLDRPTLSLEGKGRRIRPFA